MRRNLVFIAEMILSFGLMFGVGLFVLPYHATGSHANLNSDLFSLAELLAGLFLIIISVVICRRNPKRKPIAAICLGFGLGLIASVITGGWTDINDVSR